MQSYEQGGQSDRITELNPSIFVDSVQTQEPTVQTQSGKFKRAAEEYLKQQEVVRRELEQHNDKDVGVWSHNGTVQSGHMGEKYSIDGQSGYGTGHSAFTAEGGHHPHDSVPQLTGEIAAMNLTAQSESRLSRVSGTSHASSHASQAPSHASEGYANRPQGSPMPPPSEHPDMGLLMKRYVDKGFYYQYPSTEGIVTLYLPNEDSLIKLKASVEEATCSKCRTPLGRKRETCQNRKIHDEHYSVTVKAMRDFWSYVTDRSPGEVDVDHFYDDMILKYPKKLQGDDALIAWCLTADNIVSTIKGTLRSSKPNPDMPKNYWGSAENRDRLRTAQKRDEDVSGHLPGPEKISRWRNLQSKHPEWFFAHSE
ncbi:hypothetical protein HD553DRAFT_350636 [Filobasidium floriforme]|uniref:uncharacterized protein n=1 Tax=Filobasidium floriforme TaxID=5210 RepID=UPI001E8CAC6D|nr:uncharacterized protein HD553DRAFT_350636 [Filobasidium floriforme]KAH8083669.1 hypothetical protein HD553DRAFT_350636 [Filobasidium floriforme]